MSEFVFQWESLIIVAAIVIIIAIIFLISEYKGRKEAEK